MKNEGRMVFSNRGMKPSPIVDPKALKSAVLRRLVEEVRLEKAQPSTKYNRIHNRHNRGR